MSDRTASVRRTLRVRTALAMLALACAVGAGGWWLGRRDLERTVVERGRLAAALLAQGVERRLAAGEGPLAEAVAAELERPSTTLPPGSSGRFVALALVGADGGELLRRTRPGGEGLPWEPLLVASGGAPLELRERLRAGGRTLVALAGPFAPAGAGPGARLGAWFELSAEAEAYLEGRARRSALLAAGVALLTALVLHPIFRRLLERQAELSAALLDANLEALATLGSAIAKRDADTDAHNFRVVVFAVRLAEAAGLPEEDVRELIKGAFVHDVGKIGIRDAVLLKPGRLDADEFAEMKGHVEHGLEIVGRSAWLARAAEVVGGHHEKYDGSGYPRGLAGGAIPLAARVFAIADVFDAVTSDRPYHRPKSLEETLALLREGRGRHFDPELVDRFLAIAPALHARFANREEEPRREVAGIVARYFRDVPAGPAAAGPEEVR